MDLDGFTFANEWDKDSVPFSLDALEKCFKDINEYYTLEHDGFLVIPEDKKLMFYEVPRELIDKFKVMIYLYQKQMEESRNGLSDLDKTEI